MSEIWLEFCDKHAKISANNFFQNVSRFISDNPQFENENFCQRFLELFDNYFSTLALPSSLSNDDAFKFSTLPRLLKKNQSDSAGVN